MSTDPRHSTRPADRVWLITGTSSGLGLAIAEAALAVGDSVVAAVRSPSSMDALAVMHPGRLSVIQLDVTDTARIPAVVEEAIGRHGRIDVLVNSAGRVLIGGVEETTDGELRDLMEVHFFGPVALTRAVLPHMRRQGAGDVVQISSLGGRMSFTGMGGYSATKFALEGLSEALAAETRPFGVKVLIVEPGAFRTRLYRAGFMQQSTTIPVYDHIIGPIRALQADFDGKQPGDPAKAAAAILAVVGSSDPPLRLPLGSDAAEALGVSLDGALAELAAWEAVSRSTDFDR